MTKTLRLVFAVAVTISAVTSAHGAGRTKIDPNTIKKVEAPEPVGTSDKRLAQKITYDAGNKRVHDIISDLSQLSGVLIYSGKDTGDWRVRDIPMTIAARDIPLGKLLNAINFSTHTALTATKTDRGIVYRVQRDGKTQQAFDDYYKANKQAEIAQNARGWDNAVQLKDVPDAQIKPNPNGEPEAWPDELACHKAMAKLLSAVDPDMKAAILSGEPVKLTPLTAPAQLREYVTAMLLAKDSHLENRMTRAMAANGPSGSQIPQPVLDDSIIRISANDGIIKVDSCIVFGRDARNNPITAQLMDSSISLTSDLSRSGKNADKKAPEVNYPQPPMCFPQDGAFVMDAKLESSILPKTAKIAFAKDNQPKSGADALIALSKATGISFVCQDFFSCRNEQDLTALSSNEAPFTGLVNQAMAEVMPWYIDKDQKMLIGLDGAWPCRYENLISEEVLDNLASKANANGADLDDVVALERFAADSMVEWIKDDKALGGLYSQSLLKGIQKKENKPAWDFYNNLSRSDKGLAKSEAGLPLGKLDRNAVAGVLQSLIKSLVAGEDMLTERETTIYRLADPAVAPTLTMRIRQTPAKYPLSGTIKQYDYSMVIEGMAAGEKITLQIDGATNLPYLSPEREKAVTEALKTTQKQEK